MKQRAVIIGCGYTGSRLAAALSQQGIGVLGTTRAGRSIAGIEMRALDLLDQTNRPFTEAQDAILYYTVGTLFRSYDQANRLHLEVMQRFLTSIEQHLPRGIVYLSATSVYGDRHGDWVNEESTESPASPWGRMRCDLERAVWAWGKRVDRPAAVVRLPEIYGPGRSPFDRLRRGFTVRCPERWSNRIFIDDLVDVLVTLGQRLDRKLLLVSDGTPAKTIDVYRYAADLLELPPPTIGGELPTDPNFLSLVRDSKRCDNTQLRTWLGHPLRFPSYREGLENLLRL